MSSFKGQCSGNLIRIFIINTIPRIDQIQQLKMQILQVFFLILL